MKLDRVTLILAIGYGVLTLVWILIPVLVLPQFLSAQHFWSLEIPEHIVYALLVGVILFVVLRGSRREIDRQSAGRAAAQARLDRSQADLSALQQIMARTNSGLDEAVLMDALCKDAAAALKMDACTLVLFSARRGSIELGAMHGLPERFREQFSPVGFQPQTIPWVKANRPVIKGADNSDFADLPNASLYREHNVGLAAVMPLRYDREFLGALTAMTVDRQAEFDEDQLTLLTAFADQAAVIVRNRRLLEEVRERERRLGILRTGDLAILSSLDLRLTLEVFLQQVMTELGTDAASVLLLNQGTRNLEYAAGMGFMTARIKETRLALGDGFAGKIALERRSICIPDINTEMPFTHNYTRHALMEAENFRSYIGIPLISKGQVKGILEVFQRSPFHPTDQWLSFLETLAGQAAIAVDNASLLERLQRTNTDLLLAYDRTLEGWSRALDLRDRETEGHTERVTGLAVQLAQELNVREEDVLHLRRGAVLHDIGKMGVPDEILRKPDRLCPEDMEVMRQHPLHALEMLSPVDFLYPALDIPYAHHERWDGSGYPRGLKGETIPQAARIFAVVDVYDALTSDRPYRKALPKGDAIQHIRERAGKAFDPKVVQAFLTMMDRRTTPRP